MKPDIEITPHTEIIPLHSIGQDPLTPTEIEALVHPDRGIEPAPMKQFASLEDFLQNSNNFRLAFTAPEDSVTGPIYRGQKVFQRFAILHTIFASSLIRRAEGRYLADLDKTTREDLFNAYQRMSQLVDINDKDVVIDGKIDDEYLCR